MDEQRENKVLETVERIIKELTERFGPVWQTYATAGGIVIVLGALSLYFISSYNETKRSCWEKISMAQGYAYQGMTNQGIQILDDVINKYSNSGLAQYARLNKANILYDTKNYNLATNVYQEIITAGKQKSIIPFAYAGVGQSKENLADYAGAESVYREEIEKYPEHFITPRIYDSLARVYLLTGRIEDAKQAYEKLATLYPGTYWSNVAQKFVFAVSQAQTQQQSRQQLPGPQQAQPPVQQQPPAQQAQPPQPFASPQKP
jgi:tetratricopeptide (TPR) repeat protein